VSASTKQRSDSIVSSLSRRQAVERLTAGFSAPHWRNPAESRTLAPSIHQNPANPGVDFVNSWRGSCPQVTERSVFRATVLSIVLILLAGPNASVVCKALCDPAAAAATACHHTDGTPSATLNGTDDCGKAVPNSAVVKEDARRGAPSSDAQQAVMVPRHHRATFSSEAHPGDNPGWTWSLARRPLVSALRI
jgi:hypothetical protein